MHVVCVYPPPPGINNNLHEIAKFFKYTYVAY